MFRVSRYKAGADDSAKCKRTKADIFAITGSV